MKRINDFVEDLNYKAIILYVGNVDAKRLMERLDKDDVNKLWRLDYVINEKDLTMKNFMYIENCDLQNLDYPIYEYMESDMGGYNVFVLHEDDYGNYYIY